MHKMTITKLRVVSLSLKDFKSTSFGLFLYLVELVQCTLIFGLLVKLFTFPKATQDACQPLVRKVAGKQPTPPWLPEA